MLHPDGTVYSKDLGDYASLKDLAAKFRQSLLSPGDDSFRPPAKQLFNRLVAPVVSLAGESRTWKIAPDGQLHLIPYGALITDDGSFLLENYKLSLLGSGTELLDTRPKARGKLDLHVFSGPSYDSGAPDRAHSDRSGEPKGWKPFLGQIAAEGAPLQFPPLKGTVKEA